MKRIIAGLLFSFSSMSVSFANIAAGADQLINQIDPNINIGIQVFDLTTGKVVFERNASRFFIPASNMKLYSDAAALMILGPDYHFKNQLSIKNGTIKNGTLMGDLYLSLPGDPSFNRERLAHLLHSLKRWHISRINGNVVIDSGHAIVNPYAPGWMVEDLAYSYGAPLAPLMIDANRVTVTVNPGASIGDNAIVEVDDSVGGILINNSVKTRDNANRCGVDLHMDKDNQLAARGCVWKGQWAVVQKMAIRNPLTYAQGLIKQQLAQANIVLEGHVNLGQVPDGAMLLATDQSKSIAQLMADTLKPSDNLYADSLFLHAAAKLKGAPVNWAEAQSLIKQFLEQQTGISLQKAVLIDGSGLSRYDLLTPNQTVRLLTFLFDRFPLAYEYIAALPVSGRDGTLQKRFRKPNQQDLVRAKTGTMTGVVSLSGYLSTANAHTLAFAIFINNVPGTKQSVSGKYRYLVDALCSYFLRQKPDINAWAKVFSSPKLIRYQLNPTQAELQRSHQAKWRRLERVVKQALQSQAVSVLYRDNELILSDKQHNALDVMNALHALSQKYSFALALSSKTNLEVQQKPLVLWLEDNQLPPSVERQWIIREAVNSVSEPQHS